MPIEDNEQIQQEPMQDLEGQIRNIQAEVGQLGPEEQRELSQSLKGEGFSSA
jgi:hypothetical protein